jgi:hypothetical protein
MTDDYRIRLAARNESVEYQDGDGIYRFNVALGGRVWTLWLPGNKGDAFESHELTAEEEARILPRLVGYLGTIRWFRIFKRTYSVQVRRHEG